MTEAAPRRARPAPRPLVAVAAGVVVLLDQLTKWWALETLAERDIELVGSLRLHLVFNTGSAFGLARGYAPFIALAALAVVLVLLRAGRRVAAPGPRLALGLVLGGAIGNLADRAFRDGEGLLGGAVIDFVDLQWWPVFNLADVAIVVGSVVLALTAARDDPAHDDPGHDDPGHDDAGRDVAGRGPAAGPGPEGEPR